MVLVAEGLFLQSLPVAAKSNVGLFRGVNVFPFSGEVAMAEDFYSEYVFPLVEHTSQSRKSVRFLSLAQLSSGQTPLDIARKNKKQEVVEILVRADTRWHRTADSFNTSGLKRCGD